MTTRRTSARILLRRWPALAGVAFAAFLVFMSGADADLAYVIATAALIYVGAAAFKKRVAAWPVFLATVAVIAVTDATKIGADATTWILLGLGIPLAGYGLLRGALLPRFGLPLQTLALLGFGAVAVIALLLVPAAGAYLVALGLLAHAAWDAYHHRTNKVVARSYAEFCLVLDAALAVTIVAVTATA
jgi:hypothetical protein